MPNYLFDSNAIIYSAAPATANDALREMLAAPLPAGAASAMSMVEVLGFGRLTPRDREVLEATFEALEILPITDRIISAAIDLGRLYGLKAADAIIAASALADNRVLVSADTHFKRVPDLVVLNPLAT